MSVDTKKRGKGKNEKIPTWVVFFFGLTLGGAILANDFMRSSDLAFWKYEKHPVTNTTTASTTPRYKFSKSCDGVDTRVVFLKRTHGVFFLGREKIWRENMDERAWWESKRGRKFEKRPRAIFTEAIRGRGGGRYYKRKLQKIYPWDMHENILNIAEVVFPVPSNLFVININRFDVKSLMCAIIIGWLAHRLPVLILIV